MKLLFVLFSVCVLLFHGVFSFEEITVSVMEGDLVILHSGVETNKQHRIRWYFNDIRLAQITGNLYKTCTDVHCDRRFKDRLELDNKTGSLTIKRIMTSDAGLYNLKILDSPGSEKIFNATVHEFLKSQEIVLLSSQQFVVAEFSFKRTLWSTAGLCLWCFATDQKKTETVKERESVTLYTGVVNPDDFMTWYFNDILITEINGHPNKTCTDVHCEDGDERFRNRLQLDNQTGSLTITDIRTTDSGLYKLQINSSSSCIIRSFSFTVFDSHEGTVRMKAVFESAVSMVLVVPAAVCVICFFCRYHKLKKQICFTANRRNDSDETDTTLQECFQQLQYETTVCISTHVSL